MRGLVTNIAVLGVLTVGGLPVLTGTLTADETAPAAPVQQGTAGDDSTGGPPAGSPGRAGYEKNADKRAAKAAAKQARQEDGDRGGPPPWAGPRRDDGSAPGTGRGHQTRSPHGWAVREWAHCLAGAAQDLEPGAQLEPATACGGRPVPPGHLRKGTLPGAPGGESGERGKSGTRGPAGAPGQQKSKAPGRQD